MWTNVQLITSPIFYLFSCKILWYKTDKTELSRVTPPRGSVPAGEQHKTWNASLVFSFTWLFAPPAPSYKSKSNEKRLFCRHQGKGVKETCNHQQNSSRKTQLGTIGRTLGLRWESVVSSENSWKSIAPVNPSRKWRTRQAKEIVACVASVSVGTSAGLTLSLHTLKKPAYFTVWAVFWVLCCRMPLNFATKAFFFLQLS